MTDNEFQPQSFTERFETIKLANELNEHVVKMLTHHINNLNTELNWAYYEISTIQAEIERLTHLVEGNPFGHA